MIYFRTPHHQEEMALMRTRDNNRIVFSQLKIEKRFKYSGTSLSCSTREQRKRTVANGLNSSCWNPPNHRRFTANKFPHEIGKRLNFSGTSLSWSTSEQRKRTIANGLEQQLLKSIQSQEVHMPTNFSIRAEDTPHRIQTRNVLPILTTWQPKHHAVLIYHLVCANVNQQDLLHSQRWMTINAWKTWNWTAQFHI